MARYPDHIVDIPEIKGIFRRFSDTPGKDSSVFYSNTGSNPVLIGYICSDNETKMVPNDNYIELFKDEWVAKFGTKEVKPIQLRFGMYAATKVIVEKCNLKKIMQIAFNNVRTNKLLDYAMYSILFQTDITSQMEIRMADQVLFSGKIYSDSAYSNLFEKQLKINDILLFKKLWIQQCVKMDVNKVWLCIDGSNEDCKCKGVEIAEKGHAKSKKNVNIISFTYAVTPDGFPVTFNLYRGGLVDAKAMKDIIDFLQECNIEVEGVILDRGYCDSKAIKFLNEHNIAYVIMIKGEPEGYKEVVNEYKTAIKNDANQLVKKTHLYAAQKEVQLFADYKKQDHVTIFYDFLNGSQRLVNYLDKLYAEIERLESLMEKGEQPEIDSKFKKVLTLDIKNKTAEIVNSEIQKNIDNTGIYGIIHSEDMTPYEVHQCYSSRNVSEKQYNFVKTQLGYGQGAHVHFDAGTQAKFCLGFISSIIRYYMEDGADQLNMAATSYCRELNLMTMLRINKSFYYTHTEKKKQIQLFSQLGKSPEYLDEIVLYVNQAMRGYVPPVTKKKPGPKPKEKEKTKQVEKSAESAVQPQTERKKPGPKPGFRRSSVNLDGSPRQKPGPKTGSKKGKYNSDGSLRQKPGPKPGSHRASKPELIS